MKKYKCYAVKQVSGDFITTNFNGQLDLFLKKQEAVQRKRDLTDSKFHLPIKFKVVKVEVEEVEE